MVPGTGLEPVRSCLRGIFVLATAFAADQLTLNQLLLWSLDFLFVVFRAGVSLTKVRQGPSSLYTFPGASSASTSALGLARDCRHAAARLCVGLFPRI
jgi:hypothetical protein